jgi:ceramide glucosyltransferase
LHLIALLPTGLVGGLVRDLLMTICVTSSVYYLFALGAARDLFRPTRSDDETFRPPVTILKPIRGLDPEAYENFSSFCRQDYPCFQIVFGSDDADDPGLAVARRVAQDFPHVDIRIVVAPPSDATNRKVGTVAAMVPAAKHSLLLISDSDIRVTPRHLAAIVQPMKDPGVGVVTCMYRSRGPGLAGTIDALGLSTDFQPSVLVARRLEGVSFAMGSGILIRSGVLRAIGGMDAVAHQLADDYLLGNLPSRAGFRAELVPEVVQHTLGTTGLRGLVEHQLRWNRGTLTARPGGYTGLLFTQGTPAALGLLFFSAHTPGAWTLLAGTLALRLIMAWYVAVRCLRDRDAMRAFWLVPARDLFGFAAWLAAYFGRTVVWRGSRFRLEKGGRLVAPIARSVADPPVLASTEIAS